MTTGSVRRKPNPDHTLDRVRVMVEAVCSCGWVSGKNMGKGARSGAIQEWHIHRAQCESVNAQLKGTAHDR